MVRFSAMCAFNDLLNEVLVARIVSSATLHPARNVAKNKDVLLVLVVLLRLVTQYILVVHYIEFIFFRKVTFLR